MTAFRHGFIPGGVHPAASPESITSALHVILFCFQLRPGTGTSPLLAFLLFIKTTTFRKIIFVSARKNAGLSGN
ncbi:hypothetical protein HMPREF1548_02506 [Clostridium sp. KLE 1755]|jgi:hypothetical protein|uniref:Uncharacterized protein n=1 Tax=Eisenbergiella massiliensis TaxID=1720294 RepID=A0A3E3IWG0_9FIRM|nr:hypothetical protein HMPREF1548_02506 [Clostridium sp. KLE 1755]RGE59806.1 hypothetical protein DXC51_13485 [Eisenbergiella massiliensis]RGE71418.1 hypothetical protein DWY69_12465 [Eisenbergiella massiliensis]